MTLNQQYLDNIKIQRNECLGNTVPVYNEDASSYATVSSELFYAMNGITENKQVELAQQIIAPEKPKRTKMALLNAKCKSDKRKQISLLKKSKGCAKCGYRENPDILHYHHINPDTKIANVSRMVGKNHSMQRIMAEIEKCELLCITCHHKEHGLKND